MTEHPIVPTTTTTLRILQLNLGKSKWAQYELINRDTLNDEFDIILVQEPWVSEFDHSPAPSSFSPVVPETRRDESKGLLRSITWVNNKLATSDWEQLSQIGSNDISAVKIKTNGQQISIFNIYNDCKNDNTLTTLDNYLKNNKQKLLNGKSDHVIWAGDFNRHHPLWDDETETRLFTDKAIEDANRLIELIEEWDMELVLPKEEGPTLRHRCHKTYSRPDQVMCTSNTTSMIDNCCVHPEDKPVNTDHFPIKFTINLGEELIHATEKMSYNFRATDWEKYNETLKTHLSVHDLSQEPNSAEELEAMAIKLTTAIQSTTATSAKHNKPRPNAK